MEGAPKQITRAESTRENLRRRHAHNKRMAREQRAKGNPNWIVWSIAAAMMAVVLARLASAAELGS